MPILQINFKRDLSAKKFDVMEELTAITRGPVSAIAVRATNIGQKRAH